MPRPILIDLYFTLIEPDPTFEWSERAAPLLGISGSGLFAAAQMSYQDRIIGVITTPEEVISQALAQLGRQEIEPDLYAQLVAHRWSFFHSLRTYSDALPTLDALRARGHRLALVTNCSAETSVAIERLGLGHRFDALALSCDVRAAKPDPAIYRHAIEALAINPITAVYVGDGETDEHAGAARFGMTTVLLQRPGAKQRNVQADYTIASLTELLTLPPLLESVEEEQNG